MSFYDYLFLRLPFLVDIGLFVMHREICYFKPQKDLFPPFLSPSFFSLPFPSLPFPGGLRQNPNG